ncbi:MAG: Asp-tRNA(Asn)/Glu-tRNA(Gln) amidotransferase subunit GatA [Arenicellales bacterium]
MLDHSLTQIAKALRDGSISSVELTQLALDKADANARLNAFISLNPEQALTAAAAADAALKAGNDDPLCGIVTAHKDLFCTKDILTTCGSKILSNFISPYDATVIEKSNARHLVSIGKTNMDEFAMGSTTESSYYGATLNPWNTEHVPGGSSGGAAAVVAAGIVPVSTGTDTGGSVRQPAALCNLTGIKPTYGRVSRWGMVAFASSFDQAGVFANSAEDAAIMLEAICGYDEKDSTSIEKQEIDFKSDLNQNLEGMRVGLPKQFFNAELDAGIADTVMAAANELEKQGAVLVEVDLPNSALGIPCYYVLAPAEASSNLSRFDGVRYGFRAEEYTDLESMYVNTRSEGFGDEVKRRILVGTYALSSGYYDAYYIKAQKLRRLIANDFTTAFEHCDVILGPTTPHTAPKLGAVNNDPVSMYLEDIYTVTLNLAGLPGLSVPAGFDQNGLPIGMQLIGNYMQEAKILNVAHQFQQATDWHTQRPANIGGES